MARKPAKRQTERQVTVSWWDGLPARKQHLICLLALLILTIGFYAPILFSGKSLVGGDTVRWRSMAEYALRYQEEAGRPALWAPNAFGGMPAYMISYPHQVPQLDDIPAFLRETMWPASHFIFLLLGAYLLVVFITGNRIGGVLAASAYGLTTYLQVILIAGHNSKFISLCFAPWLVLAFAYVLRRPKLLSALLFAVALGVNLRGGHVQITYYISFLMGIWWVVELVGALRRKQAKPFVPATGWLALGSVLGLLLVAQPYLANFEYKRYTIRGAVEAGAAGLDWTYAMGWSQGIGELVTLIAADAFGGASPTYWGPKPFTEGPHYIGAIVILLAVIAVWRHRTNFVTALAVGSVLMVLFSLGEHLPFLNRLMYEHFPLFNAFRVPETWLSAVAFAWAVLAGIGLHQAQKIEPKPLYGALGVVGALLLFLMLFSGTLFEFDRPNEAEQLTEQVLAQNEGMSAGDPRVQSFVRQTVADLRVQRSETFGDEILRALIFLTLAGILLILNQKGKIPSWVMQSAIVLLVVVDLWGVGRRYLNEERLVDSADVEDLIATYDFDRFILERQAEAGGPGHFRVLSLESGSPFTNARPSFHYESIGGYHGAKLRLIQDYIDEMFINPQTGLPDDNALDLLGARYVVARGRLPGTQVVYQGEQTGIFVLENSDAAARAYFVGEARMVDLGEQIAEIRDEEFDPRRTALVSEPVETSPIDASSTAEVDLKGFSPREITWSVSTDAPRLMVANEIYYPAGWEALIDGEEVPIHRVNYLLRGVEVPEGEHEVEMRFNPASHRLGVWISAIATFLVYGLAAGIIGHGSYRRRQAGRGVAG